MQSPDQNCQKCPRLCTFREENRAKFLAYHNAPVPSFGELSAELLVVGLAPGLHGANQTGRPFTGDYAGLILYSSLLKHGFAQGQYNPASLCHPGEGRDPRLTDQTTLGMDPGLRRDDKDTLMLKNCRITNAVRCVPQENKPEPSEIKNCNIFLKDEIAVMPNLKVILSLGLVSHNAVLKALGMKASAAKFAHGAIHQVAGGGWRVAKNSSSLHSPPPTLHLFNSYHCSRYNINTGRLTQAMFDTVVEAVDKSIRKSMRESMR